MIKHIVVVGCGKSGSEIANKMSDKGFFVTVVDRDKKAFLNLNPSFSGFSIERNVVDIKSISTLVENIDLLLVVTENDDLNIYLSIAAKNILEVDTVITRLYDDSKSFIFNDIDIDVIYPSKLALDEIHSILEARQ